MTPLRASLGCLALCLTLAGCAVEEETDLSPSTVGAALSVSDAHLVLELVNYPGTDLVLLDEIIDLDVRAARGIIAHRDGVDGIAPSLDDRPFQTIAELDAISYVGDSAFTKLHAYAVTHPVPSAEIVEGVTFEGWQAQAVIWGVNRASAAQLDELLDVRAANALAASAPYASVTDMGPQAYVGVTALTALREGAGAWWALMRTGAASLAGTFDGVVFDEATARVAVEIANLATAPDLVAHGMTTSTANTVVAARPYATVAQIAETSGVGPATMSALHGYASSGTWVPPAPLTFLLDATALASATASLKATVRGDAAFQTELAALGGDVAAITAALAGEIDRLAAPLLSTRYASESAATAAVGSSADPRPRVRADGWAYLATLGLVPPSSGSCIAGFIDAVQPHLGDVLLLSESDRPVDIVSFPGAGGSAPTASSVRALLGATGTTIDRTPSRFFQNLEPSSDMADPGAAAAIQAAFEARVTDAIYVGFQNGAVVDVYVIGRTTCGDLVGLHSVTIET